MSKKSKEILQKFPEESLTDDKLEDVSGGHIELVEDKSTVSANGRVAPRLNTGHLSRGDYGA